MRLAVVLFITTGSAYNMPVLSVTFTVASELDLEDEEEPKRSRTAAICRRGRMIAATTTMDNGNESPNDDSGDEEEEDDEEGVHPIDLQAIPAVRY